MNRQHQEHLLAEFIHGCASEADLKILLEELRNDPALKQQLAAMLLIDHSLYAKHDDRDGNYMRKEVLNHLQREDSGRHFASSTIDRIKHANTGTRKSTRGHRRKTTSAKPQQEQLWWIIGAAAAVLFIIIGMWPSAAPIPQTQPDPEPIVKLKPAVQYNPEIGTWKNIQAQDLIHAINADQRSRRCYIGDTINSSAETLLILDDDSHITIAAGSSIEIKGSLQSREIYLHSGSLTAQISKQTENTAILFPTSLGTARIVGTSFNLSRQADSSRLEVYSGKIEQSHNERNEKVFVEAGHYVDIIPDAALLVKTLKAEPVIETPLIEAKKPVAVVIPDPPVIERPFYEWSLNAPLGKEWIRGDLRVHVKCQSVHSGATHDQQIIYARLEKPDRQALQGSDEFHFTVRAKQETELHIDIYLADNNPATLSTAQYARYSYTIDAERINKSIPLHFTLADLELPHKHFISANHGCFAIRISSNADTAFSLQRALIKRSE